MRNQTKLKPPLSTVIRMQANSTSQGNSPSNAVPEWIQSLGILDRETALVSAARSEALIRDVAKELLRARSDVSIPDLILRGFVTQAQGLATATSDALNANNPPAAFTLLRAYFENAAAILYVTKKPEQLQNLMGNEQSMNGIAIGRITNFAATVVPESKKIYNLLSKFAHPNLMGLFNPTVIEGQTIRWSSVPRFRTENELLTAAAWLHEITEMTVHFMVEYASVHLASESSDTTEFSD